VRDLHLALAFGLGYHCTLVMLILLYLQVEVSGILENSAFSCLLFDNVCSNSQDFSKGTIS
jgi:hypothetical protein